MRIIDLTLTICNNMLTFPSYWHPQVEVSLMGRHEREGRETRKLILGTHTGTHIDAPSHFIKGGKTIEEIELEYLIGPAIVVDFSKKGNKEISYKEVKEALEKFKDKNIKRVLFRYDWSEKWGSPDYYVDYPFFSFEACKYIVECGIKLIGLDTPSPDSVSKNYGTEEDSPNHKLLLSNDVMIIEYLCNMKKITKEEVDLLALPLKIEKADGAPCRCVVIEK